METKKKHKKLCYVKRAKEVCKKGSFWSTFHMPQHSTNSGSNNANAMHKPNNRPSQSTPHNSYREDPFCAAKSGCKVRTPHKHIMRPGCMFRRLLIPFYTKLEHKHNMQRVLFLRFCFASFDRHSHFWHWWRARCCCCRTNNRRLTFHGHER